MAKQFENEHFPMAQKEEEEKAVDLTAAKTVVNDGVSTALGKLVCATKTVEMRENAAIRRFIQETDPYWNAITRPDPVLARELLERMAANPVTFCQEMSTRHHYVMLQLAEHCLHRKL